MKTSSTDVDRKKLLLSRSFFPSFSLFLSGAAHLGCYESNRCGCDGVITHTHSHHHPPHHPSPSPSSSLLLCWTVIRVYFPLNYNCKNCHSAVCLFVVCHESLFVCAAAPLPLSPARSRSSPPSPPPGPSSVLGLRCSVLL